MAFDYKKEEREFYPTKTQPSIVNVPQRNFIAVSGAGNPNVENGSYQQSIMMLYGIAYTIKMAKNGDHQIEGYFDFVVPPLEGFWWIPGLEGMDSTRKDEFNFISMIRMPEFVTKEVLDWAVAQATAKKKMDYGAVELLNFEEGLCVQALHLGEYDTEPATVALIDEYAHQNGFEPDLSESRHHHEIYLSDPRKTAPEKIKTIIRHPIKKIT